MITEDVGGAFGLKSGAYPEYPALLAAAKTFGRKIHWMASRSEAFNSDNQARDNVTIGELALDENGNFRTRAKQVQNLGAYVASAGIQLATNNYARCFPAMCDIPKLDISVQCVYTNTLPTGPYRGAGRPEANYVIEMLVEEAARVTGIDRVTLRRRNLIPASAMPYKTAVGTTFDSGEFPEIFRQGAGACRHRQFRTSAAANRKPMASCAGLACPAFLEHSGGVPNEGAYLTFPGKDTLTVNMNVGNTGQGHATVYPRLVAEKLGIDVVACEAQGRRQRSGDQGLAIGRLALDHHRRHALWSAPSKRCWKRARRSPHMCSKPTRRTSPMPLAPSR